MVVAPGEGNCVVYADQQARHFYFAKFIHEKVDGYIIEPLHLPGVIMTHEMVHVRLAPNTICPFAPATPGFLTVDYLGSLLSAANIFKYKKKSGPKVMQDLKKKGGKKGAAGGILASTSATSAPSAKTLEIICDSRE